MTECHCYFQLHRCRHEVASHQLRRLQPVMPVRQLQLLIHRNSTAESARGRVCKARCQKQLQLQRPALRPVENDRVEYEPTTVFIYAARHRVDLPVLVSCAIIYKIFSLKRNQSCDILMLHVMQLLTASTVSVCSRVGLWCFL